MGDESVLERILSGEEEPKDLPLALLQQITNDFSEDRKIGQGGFGVVYKGVLRNGIIVAVKRMYVNEHTIDDVSFRREINSLMKINHENVVRFLGFCSHTYHTSIKVADSTDLNFVNVRERLLCLEYISNESLDKHITDELRGLEWETRYKILIRICIGLRYLHEGKQIVHMDLKPANLLLDDHMVPKITDFGLSRPNKNSHTIGQRFGTRGYLAPEYNNSGKTSVKSDMYSLGAIIIELVTGSLGAPDEKNVLRRWRHRWNKPPTLLQYQQVTRCIDIAGRCRQQEPGHRPSISEIISILSELHSTNGDTCQMLQISPCYDEDDVLGIKPLELRLPSEVKKEISCLVELTNGTTNCIAFNIQPSNTPWHSAQPDKGIVQPQSNYCVKIIVPPQDMSHANNFIVKNMKVSEVLRDEDIIEHMFEEDGKVVDEVNLMVVYEPLKPQEHYKSREDTNMLAKEVPQVERREIVESSSGKGKFHSSENAEAAYMDIDSSMQGQHIKKTELCNFYPPQSFSHHSLGPLLMSLLGSVAAKARDTLVADLLTECGQGKAQRKLEHHLAAVQCILLDADAKSRTNSAARQWMADLKTAAYHTDDVLDDFRYEALCRPADQLSHRSTRHKMLRYFTANSPVVFRLSIRRKMKDALEMIDELVVRMSSFQFLQHAEAPSIDHPQTHSQVDQSEIVGRQDEKEQVVKILLDHSKNNANNSNVMVVPIVGMGGIGKTTLAQLVHNDQRVKHHFDLVLWTCVSDKFVMEEIIRSVLEVATMKKCDLTQMEALQKDLSRVLGKRRYLLVLDDVWNEDRQKWDDMRSLLCSHGGPGSAIIVRSRSDQVASIMGTIPARQISLLDEDQSWELFHRNTFGTGLEKQEELISIAKSIVHKCKGLPFAIKTIAVLLRSKHPNQWFSVLESDVWKNDILATGIVPALQLSYDHLSWEEKICFSFCAIFPKDSIMDKDMLIQLWMANDFVASEIRGQQIFDVLVWRCFLQDVAIQINRLPEFPDEYDLHTNNDILIHRPTTCKMHDLMHDLADLVSGNDCSILQGSLLRKSNDYSILQGSLLRKSNDYSILPESSLNEHIGLSTIDARSLQHEVRHLSLDSDCYGAVVVDKILAPKPRTILALEGRRVIPFMANSKSVSLRALKTSLIVADMTNLRHLRYLDCSYSSISELPEATTMLYSLQTLKLLGCGSLRRLPKGMRYMSSLRHVILVGCDYLECMPQDIGQLSSLQTLTSYIIDRYAGCGIDQLKHLNLAAILSLTDLGKVPSAESAKQGHIFSKHNLKRLSLNWHGPRRRYIGYEEDNTKVEGILEALRPHQRLEVLVISNYAGAKFSSWMHSTLLEQLSELRLSSCQNCKDLPPLWQLPSLRYLSLVGLHSLTSICIGNDDIYKRESCISRRPFFPKLEYMRVHIMPKLERLNQEVAGQVEVVSFPRLKKIIFSRCPRVETLPEVLLRRLPALDEIHIRDCPKLGAAFSRGGAYWNFVEAVSNRFVC